MGLFDQGQFSPDAYQSSAIPGWLMQAIQGGLLGKSAGFGNDQAALPPNSQPAGPMMMSPPAIPSQTDREGMAGYSPLGGLVGQPQQPMGALPQAQPMQMAGPPMGAPMPPQSQPGLGDKLGAGLAGFFSGNGMSGPRTLSGALSGAAEGFSTGMSPQTQAVQALTKSGISPEIAALVAKNPQLLQSVIQSTLLPKTTFGVIGKDKFGNDIHGFINPAAKTVEPANLGGIATPAGQGGDPNLTGQAYLESLDKPEADQVKAIVEGRLSPPGSFALKTPYWQRMLQSAAQYEPGFDMTKWGARVATAKDFASGQSAKNVTALNTVVGHLGDLMDKADKLNNINSGFGPANQWANFAKNEFNNASGSPEVNNFRLARNAVSDEMAKVFRSSGMSDHEIQQWKSTINESMTPDQLKGAVKTGISLMESRLSALADQRNRGMSTSIEPRALLNPKSVETLKKVEDWASGASLAKPAEPSAIPAVGEVRRGYSFVGGDPSKPENWKKQ